jgi:hypothetical protein
MFRLGVHRIVLVTLLTTVAMVLSFVPGSSLLSSQVAGAAQPTGLTLSASPNPATTGAPVTFTATLSGGLASPMQPVGSISVAAYTSSNCSDPSPAFTLGVDVNGNGAYALPTTAPAPGTYYGEAYFADTDGDNASASSGSCTPILVVDPALTVPSLQLHVTPNPAPSLHPVTFKGVLTGGHAPVGQISLGAYTTPNCSNNPSFTLAVNVSGNGTYTIGTESHLTPGTYYGSAFFADTDGNNASVGTGSCAPILVVRPPSNVFSIALWFLSILHL